jgi:negative regulator of replication initiation
VYLTNEYARYAAYTGHIGEQIAFIEARLLEIKNELEAIESAVRRTMRARSARGTKPTKEELTDECRENPRYNDLLLQEQYYEQERKILEARRDTYLRAGQVVSRTVTLRGQDIESNMRSHTMGNPVMGRDFG